MGIVENSYSSYMLVFTPFFFFYYFSLFLSLVLSVSVSLSRALLISFSLSLSLSLSLARSLSLSLYLPFSHSLPPRCFSLSLSSLFSGFVPLLWLTLIQFPKRITGKIHFPCVAPCARHLNGKLFRSVFSNNNMNSIN